MNQSIHCQTRVYPRILILLCAIGPLSGCTTLFEPGRSSKTTFSRVSVPADILRVSNAVRSQFIYNNDIRPTWPPRRTHAGLAVGNCSTYSRLVAGQLRRLGLQPRYRNVLAPERIAEHVITIVTDEAGHDWVLDNRFETPYSASLVSSRYRFEPGNSNRFVGAMRKKWVSSKPRIDVADARIIR